MKKLFVICTICFAIVILTFSLIHSFEEPKGFMLRNPITLDENGISDPLALFILGLGVIGMARIAKREFLKQQKLGE